MRGRVDRVIVRAMDSDGRNVTCSVVAMLAMRALDSSMQSHLRNGATGYQSKIGWDRNILGSPISISRCPVGQKPKQSRGLIISGTVVAAVSEMRKRRLTVRLAWLNCTTAVGIVKKERCGAATPKHRISLSLS